MSLTKASYSMISGAPVNILDYGASTSSANNTVAIQAAIDTGLDVYIPAGVFLCTDTLSMNTPYQTLFGDGKDSQITFTFASSKEGLIMGVPTGAVACEKQTLRNVYLRGTANVSKLLSIKGPECNILSNRLGNESNGSIIYLEDENTPTGIYCFGQRIVNNFIDGVLGTTGIGIRLGTYNQTTQILYNIITDCSLAIYVNGATTSLNIVGNTIQNITASNAAIYIHKAGSAMPAYNISITNNYFEQIHYVVSVGDCAPVNLVISNNYSYRNGSGSKVDSAFYVANTNTSAAAENITINNNYIEDFGIFLQLDGEYSSKVVSVVGNALNGTTNYSTGTYLNNAYSYIYTNPYISGNVISGTLLAGSSAARIESKDAVIYLPINWSTRDFATTLSFYFSPNGANAVTVELFKVAFTSSIPVSVGSVTASTETTASIALNASASASFSYYAVATFNNAGTSGYLFPLVLTIKN